MNDITGIREGDAAVFRAVYEQLHVKVFRYFLKRTALHETATELTQQLFIKLWQSRHTLSDSYSMEAQIFIIANSVLIDHLRKEAVNRKKYSTVAGFEPLAETRYEQEAHHSLEASDYLRLAIHQLPPVRKKVFILKMLHGYSNREIAGRLNCPIHRYGLPVASQVQLLLSVQEIAYLLGIELKQDTGAVYTLLLERRNK